MASRREEPDSLPDVVRDLAMTVVAYVRQETVEPVKNLGRFLGYGVGAVLLSGLGVILLCLGGLRLLQNETGSAFTGHLSFVPYLFPFVLCVVVAALVVRAAAGGSGRPTL